jgi:hypothetical protein
MIKLETALAVPVPEAEPLVAPFRVRYDPGAGRGMPAHITVLYPFKSPDTIDAATLAELHDLFGAFRPFDFRLEAIRQFLGEALYLSAQPEEHFRHLTLAAWHRFPETPPYGGRYTGIVPHLTVALVPDTTRLAAITREFTAATQNKLPVPGRAAGVALFDTTGGRWHLQTVFPFTS